MKRYTPYLDVPYESDLKGEWVRQEDVEALLALNAEMLEALETIVATNPHNMPMTHEQIRSAYAESLRTARTAIAKAKGEKP